MHWLDTWNHYTWICWIISLKSKHHNEYWRVSMYSSNLRLFQLFKITILTKKSRPCFRNIHNPGNQIWSLEARILVYKVRRGHERKSMTKPFLEIDEWMYGGITIVQSYPTSLFAHIFCGTNLMLITWSSLENESH